jgi:hypothetical protein
MNTERTTGLNGQGGVDLGVVRTEYLCALAGGLAANCGRVSLAVERAMSAGLGRKELEDWGVEAGYSRGYLRTVLSRYFVKRGVRQRKAGAGPKTPKEAQALLVLARKHYGENARKFLGAAARAAAAEDRTPAEGQAEGPAVIWYEIRCGKRGSTMTGAARAERVPVSLGRRPAPNPWVPPARRGIHL